MPQWLVDTVVNLWHQQSCCNSSENSFSAQMSAQTRPCIQLPNQRWALGADSSIVAHAPLLAAANSQCFCHLSLHLFLLFLFVHLSRRRVTPAHPFVFAPVSLPGVVPLLHSDAVVSAWHVSHPRHAPRLTRRAHAGASFPLSLFCHLRFERGFYLQVMMKGAAEFLWFPCESTPAEGTRRDAFWHHLTLALVWLPTVHSAGLLLYSDRFTCGCTTTYLSVPAGGGGCLSWHDYSLSISSDKWDRCSGCCGGSASVTLHTLPEPQTKLPNPSRSAVTHWHGVPLGGGCAFAAAMYCRFGAAIFKASIIASYSIRSLSAAASDFPTICWMMRSRRVAPEERWNPIFAALRRFSPTTRHCSLSLTRHRDC